MRYKQVFFDLDHTLWDFDANARQTLQQMHMDLRLVERGVHDFDLFHKTYLQHNEKLWERYRKGFIKQDELRLKRMWLCLLDFKIPDEALAKEMSDIFLQLLPTCTVLFPNTIEILEYLQDKKYKLALITNGFEKTQHSKLKSSGLDRFFPHVITSEGSNSLKPQKEIFEYAMKLTGSSAGESIMIGDSLEVDIAGALNAGMDAVHTNFINTAQNDIRPTHTITSLEQLRQIL